MTGTSAALFRLLALIASVGVTTCETGIALPPLPPPSMKPLPPAYTIPSGPSTAQPVPALSRFLLPTHIQFRGNAAEGVNT